MTRGPGAPVRGGTPAALAASAAAALPETAEAARLVIEGLRSLGAPAAMDTAGSDRLADRHADELAEVLADAVADDPPAVVLDLADHLVRAGDPALAVVAAALLDRALPAQPVRAWQLLRAGTRGCRTAIAADALAVPAARGVLLEPYRWAELEQLVLSPSPWERRLAAGAVAVLAASEPEGAGDPELVRRGLALVADLLGDPDPEVREGLADALRALLAADPNRATAFVAAEAATATATADGNRAAVLRAVTPGLGTAGAPIDAALTTLRADPSAPSTSRAAATAAAFSDLGVAVDPAARPLVPRG